MKRTKLLNVLIMTALIFSVFSCDKTIENEEEIVTEPTVLGQGQVEIKVYPDSGKQISFWAVVQKMTIDWGDGSVEESTINGELVKFSHEYANQNLQKILISTQNMEAIGWSEGYPSQGTFHELRLGNCPDLQEIVCAGQSLAVFEIEKANALLGVDCSNNNLSSATLNTLFETLPAVPEGYVYYKGNPGSEECNLAIATAKGWKEDMVYLPIESIFDSEEGVRTFLATTFTCTADFVQSFYLFESLYTNAVDENSIASSHLHQTIYRHEVTPENDLVNTIWINAYKTIQYENTIIAELLKLNKPEYFKYIHTASVLRAYTYFIMINLWGDLPFLNETNYNDIDNMSAITRMPQTEILQALIHDLVQAEQYLPESAENDSLVLSNCFAQLVLSKIYSCQQNDADALQYAKSIMDSRQFELSPDYPAIFNSKTNKEWMIPATAYESASIQYWMSLIKKGGYMSFARYAEVILLAAESNLRTNKLPEAVTLVNMLKARNNRPLLEPGAPAEQITDAILEEYRLDQGKEGLYFFALKRFGKAEDVLHIASYRKYLPVPQREIYTNPNITQNAGY